MPKEVVYLVMSEKLFTTEDALIHVNLPMLEINKETVYHVHAINRLIGESVWMLVILEKSEIL